MYATAIALVIVLALAAIALHHVFFRTDTPGPAFITVQELDEDIDVARLAAPLPKRGRKPSSNRLSDEERKARQRASSANHYQANKDRIKERQRNKRVQKAAAEGRQLGGWTPRNLGVSPAKDGKAAYNKAYQDSIRATGNTPTTFTFIPLPQATSSYGVSATA